MDGNIFRKIEIQKLKILFVYDHVLREPDLFILKKALEYKNKFKKYIDIEFLQTNTDESLLESIIDRKEANLFKWISISEFDYEKNYNYLYSRWKTMYAESPKLAGYTYLNRYVRSDYIAEIYIWNEEDDVRQRFDIANSFDNDKVFYVTGPLQTVLEQCDINVVYDYDTKRVRNLLDSGKFNSRTVFGVAAYGFNFISDENMILKDNIFEYKNTMFFPIINQDLISFFKG